MRLIDADKFIEWIDAGHLRHPSELVYSEIDVVNLINHQPTAYDVEAVVRELEKEITRTKEKERQCFMDNNVKMGFCLNGRASAMNFAIEIVKAGGRNEEKML